MNMDENNKRKRRNNRRRRKNSTSKRTSKAWEMVMSDFLDDLWIEIFLRLPFESLLRFKSVSKSWFSIISSHRFAKSHFANTAKDDQILVVHHDGFDSGEDGHFSLFHLDSGRILKNLKFPYSQGEYPFELDSSKLIGSDCGIVCVCVHVYYWSAAKSNYDLYLWNPATKHSKLLPPPAILDVDDNRSRGALGFGFDHIDLDFKVVRVLSHTHSAQVYSTNMKEWRKIQLNPTNIPYNNDFHVCLHGFLFTMGQKSVMAFNLNKEVFICDINLPVSSNFTRVTDFKDAVAITIPDTSKINLWTLDNEACLYGHGVKASWTKVLSIDLGVPLDFVEGHFNDFQFILSDLEGDRFLYNSNNKVTTTFPSPPYLDSFEFFKYTKSLFSLVGFKRIKWAASSSSSEDSLD